MSRHARLSKVNITESRKEQTFATPQYMIDSLHAIKVREKIPIFDMLSLLLKTKIDSVSCSRDDPQVHFYARRTRDVVAIVIRSSEGAQKLEFEVPTSRLRQDAEIAA